MYKIDGKYGNIHIEGMSIDINRMDVDELKKYLQKLEETQTELIEQQNNYLSQIIE